MDRLLYVLPAFILAIFLVVMYEIYLRKLESKVNKVHFYVTRDKNSSLNLWLNKPVRHKDIWGTGGLSHFIVTQQYFGNFGLNPSDYNNLNWEDEPVEIFLNMED